MSNKNYINTQLPYCIDEIIGRLKDLKRFSKDFEVAELIGLLPHDFSKRKKSGTLITPIVKWAIAEEIDLNWLLRGQRAQTQKCYDKNSGLGEVSSGERNNSHHLELLKKTKRILESKTEYSNSLSANIDSFHRAMENEERLNRIESEIAALKSENGRFKRQVIVERRKEDRRKANESVENDRRSGKDRRNSLS